MVFKLSIMEKYAKYFNELKKMFLDSYELAGEKEFRYFHCVNVANIANELADKVGIQEDGKEIIIISAIFHDVAKYMRVNKEGMLDGSHTYEEENDFENHELQSAKMVGNFLSKSLSKPKITMIQKTIANHSHPDTVMEKILHDADELSEMGLMNFWKMATYSAYKKRDIIDTTEYWFKKDRLRHSEKKDKLFLEESKKEAEERILLIDKIFNDLENQLNVL